MSGSRSTQLLPPLAGARAASLPRLLAGERHTSPTPPSTEWISTDVAAVVTDCFRVRTDGDDVPGSMSADESLTQSSSRPLRNNLLLSFLPCLFMCISVMANIWSCRLPGSELSRGPGPLRGHSSCCLSCCCLLAVSVLALAYSLGEHKAVSEVVRCNVLVTTRPGLRRGT